METQDRVNLDYKVDLEQNTVENSLDEERESLLQFRENIARAEALPFHKIMEQGAESFSPGDLENRELETELEKTNKLVRRMRLQREREEETDVHPFPRSTKTKGLVPMRSRSNSTEHGGARARTFSESSTETGPRYSSGQEEYYSAEENTQTHGRSIIASRTEKIGLSEFQPVGFENFDNVCRLVSDGNQLEHKVNEHFRAQYRNTKATHQELQSQFYRTELSVCQDSMNKELTILAKEADMQNNEKCKLNSVLRVFETQSNERLEANNNLKLVMEGFKSSAHFDKEHADERLLTEQIKAHMTIIKRTPLIGQDMMGIHDEKPIKLGFQLSPEVIEKLGKFKQIYDACVSAQKRFKLACTKI